MSLDENGVPIVPDSLQLYNSYTTDPPFARAFNYTWAAFAAVCILISAPRLWTSVRNGRLWASWKGVGEEWRGYQQILEEEKVHSKISPLSSWRRITRSWGTLFLSWSLYQPFGLTLDVGQILVLAGYLATLLVCILKDSQLDTNSNRAGFLTLAQLPLLFLLASKNSLLAFLLGRGYEKLNFLHRWAGRGILLSATVHGSLWIRSHLRLNVSFNQDKERHGLSAYAVLCTMTLLSLRPVRNKMYQFFFLTHICGMVAFFALICYHTPYAAPWIYPPLTFYALDLLIRAVRYRFKQATLVASDSLLTQINVERCDFGWTAGQHVRIRVFIGKEVFESHPLSIANAPAEISNISSKRGELLLGARVVGDWSKSLNVYAQTLDNPDVCCGDKGDRKEAYVMIDGPYGGLSIDLGSYESVLLVAGGAGVTFTMGVLDDIVGRIVKRRKGGERTRRIEFCWCIKSFGCINWFAPQLEEIASSARKEPSLEVHMKFFVTCLCDPEALPPIHNSETTMERPSISKMLDGFVSTSPTSLQRGDASGIGVVAAGPEGLVRGARNAVAGLGGIARRMGGVALHTEVFCL